METVTLTLGHSPDPDDAFMFYGLAKDLIPTPGLRFEHILQDIQTLNERATRGELDISAISIHAYAYVSETYALLPSGASMGDGYGPMLVARERLDRETVARKRIAIPGRMTSAFLALQLWLGKPAAELDLVVVPFDEIFAAVKRGEAVGLLGPNGAGKTTTFYMITGLVQPDEGQVLMDGHDVTSLPMYRRARLGLGYLPQEASIFRKLTVAQNVRAVLELQEDEQGRALSAAAIDERLETLLRDLVNLAITIRDDGQVNPLTVVDASQGVTRLYRIETGERRYWATWLLRDFIPGYSGDGMIPCIIIPANPSPSLRRSLVSAPAARRADSV